MDKNDLDTPALVVERAVLDNNIVRMQRTADEFGVRLRPHTKTHKSPHIARLQIEAGAAGITVAKLGEAEVMAEAGLDDILIANQVIGPKKTTRLVELAGRVRLAVLVDSAEGLRMLDAAFDGAGLVLDVLIEVDTGKGRCGLTEMYEIVALADEVAGTSNLRLRGVETHEGHVAGDASSEEAMRDRAIAAGERMVEVAEVLSTRGYEIEEISVGSTPAAPWTASVSGITEMRPGTYVFNDVNQMCIGQATPEDCALSVLTTVISRPVHHRAVLDAGSKALFSEPAREAFALADYDGYGFIRNAPGARIVSLSEEHAVVSIPKGEDFPDIGAQVEVIPNHVCPVVNLHDELFVLEGDDVAVTWPVAARGRVR